MSSKYFHVNLLALASMAVGAAHAQLKWDGCTDLTAAQMKKTLLISRTATGAVAGTTAVDPDLKEPVKLSVSKAGNVYLVERNGNIKIWKSATGTMVNAGKLSVYWDGKLPNAQQANNENGLTGIALDPNFETNNFVYLHYAPLQGNFINIGRFEIKNDVLDKSTEKVLMQLPMQRNSCCHTGGAMQFDLDGNLYFTVGNNTTNPAAKAADAYLKESDPDADDQGHAANTNDYRGKVLKIHPNTTPAGGYTVPAGNLFPAGTAQTKPEIWAMGIRNPYSMAVDPYRGWVAWGEVGPDDGLAYSEEWNLLTRPGNGGWPYFVGGQAWRPALNKVATALVNNSPNNTGLKNLPNAIPAAIGYQQSCAVTGPLYYYNGANASTKKLPPHLNKKWLVSDWWKGNLEVVNIDDNGAVVGARTTLMQQNTFNGPLDFQVGPDGALYVIEYGQVGGGLWFTNAGNTAISRVEYTGTCHPATPVPPTVSVQRGTEMLSKGSFAGSINLGYDRSVTLPVGATSFRLFDIQGRLAWEYKVVGNEMGSVKVPASVGNGVLRVKYEL